MTVTFFGHRDCPDKIYNNIKETIIELIRNKNADYFYIGDNGYYDFLVRKALHEIKSTYTELEFCVVLAYMPTKSTKSDYDKFNTIYPDGLENVPYKFAIYRRNEWMLKRSEMVVTYVHHNSGGAFKFKEKALKLNKTVIELSE